MIARKQAVGHYQLLQASPEGTEKALKALKHHSLTLKAFAQKELKVSLYTVNKFFKGKLVEPQYFYKICERLNLDWHEIVAKPAQITSLRTVEDPGSDIDALVEEVRQKSHDYTVRRCGTMQVLDMTQPIGLNDIYVDVNILEIVNRRRQLEIVDLLQRSYECDRTAFRRCGLGRITEERVPGITAVEKYSKLMVLGKPGVGKTTFLKYLAIQCSLDHFKINKVPIFISVKDFAEAKNQPSLLLYITQLLNTYAITENQTNQILNYGRVMLLLDGLDEVKEEHNYWVLKQIQEFFSLFNLNQFVITCRIAGQEHAFENFTEVEVADFDARQTASFTNKWFAIIDPIKGDRFIQKLQENEPIQELATNPLLLTLLCLVFTESADFPVSRSHLYKEGLDLLLKKWDAIQNIERSQIYKNLSTQHKQDLLSQIALKTFEQGDYFFKQQKVEEHIADYIRNLPDSNDGTQTLQLNSTAVLKSIEVQHGLLVERAKDIYSFSHLTFQEYFAARQIVRSWNPQILEVALKQLVSQITEKRWREVFLLSVGMLRNADYLLQLMKQQIQQLIAEDEHLQAFLRWVNQKSVTVNVPYRLVAVRAFYLAIARTICLVSNKTDIDKALALAGDIIEIAFSLDPTFTFSRVAYDLTVDRALTLVLARAIDLNRVSTCELGFKSFFVFAQALIPEIQCQEQKSPLAQSVKTLLKQLPHPDKDIEKFKEWWQVNGKTWTEQLRAVIIFERNIGHDWQFSDQQRKVLNNYYNANQLLMECLNSDCYVNRGVRQELEETLFLPAGEIAKEL